jgi:hypothetical protein
LIDVTSTTAREEPTIDVLRSARKGYGPKARIAVADYLGSAWLALSHTKPIFEGHLPLAVLAVSRQSRAVARIVNVKTA